MNNHTDNAVIANFATSEFEALARSDETAPEAEAEDMELGYYARLIDYYPDEYEQEQVKKMQAKGYQEYTINAYLLQCKYQKIFDSEGEHIKAFIRDYKRLAEKPYLTIAETFKDKAEASPDRNAYSHFYASFTGTYYKNIYELEELRKKIRNILYQPIEQVTAITKLLNM